MSTNTGQVRIPALGGLTRESDKESAIYWWQNAFLSELPGLAFAITTLIYIAGAFASLV